MGFPQVSGVKLDPGADPNCRHCGGTGMEWYTDSDGDADRDVCRCVIDRANGRMRPGDDRLARIEAAVYSTHAHAIRRRSEAGRRRWLRVCNALIGEYMKHVTPPGVTL